MGYEDYDLTFASLYMTAVAQNGIVMSNYHAQEVCTASRASDRPVPVDDWNAGDSNFSANLWFEHFKCPQIFVLYTPHSLLHTMCLLPLQCRMSILFKIISLSPISYA